ncbi:MAG: cobalamin-binding protein [Halothiobacillaceae bacterium]
MGTGMRVWLALVLGLLMGSAAAQPVCVPAADDTPFCLDQPARRVVSLAPHLTEMLFAIGVTPVGVVEYSDHPPAARGLPSIGPYHSPDFERLMLLHPDLVVAWKSGIAPALLERLRGLGLKVLLTRGQALEDIPRELRALGQLTGQVSAAEQAATTFERELDALTAQHAQARKLSGFYEIWSRPLITVSDAHFIGQAMARCGIRNIVGSAMGKTPTWSEEAVLRARPELLITSAPARDFDRWRRWKDLPAVQHDALIILPPDVLIRPGPRLIEGILALCAAADRHRQAQP